MSQQRGVQELQRVFPLQPPRWHDGQDAFHEATAVQAAAAEAPLPPQHRAAQQPLHEVVGRLHVLDAGERPQRRASNANRFSQKAATVLSSPKIAPSSKTRSSRFLTGSSWLCSCARVVWPSWSACHAAKTFLTIRPP